MSRGQANECKGCSSENVQWCQDCADNACRSNWELGRAQELARVVAWLRAKKQDLRNSGHPHGEDWAREWADALERKEHR